MTLGFLLLERAEVTQGQYPTGRNDISEAALALATAADLCESAMQQTAPPSKDEGTGEDMTAEGGTADVDGFGYPRWSDLFDCRLERAYLARGVNKAQWARQMRATIAWRCRSLLSDLAGANQQQEEALRQARAAVVDLPEEAEGFLRLARNEAMVGQLELAAHHYYAGLTITPFAYAAWPELIAVLNALLGQPDAAQTFVQERLRVLNAIPTLAAIRPALMAAIE